MQSAFGGMPQARGVIELGFELLRATAQQELIVCLDRPIDLLRNRVRFEHSIRNAASGIDHARMMFNDDINVGNYKSQVSVMTTGFGGGPTSSSGRFIDMPASSNMWAMGDGWIGRNPHGYLVATTFNVIGSSAGDTPDEHTWQTVTWAGGGAAPPALTKVRLTTVNANGFTLGDWLRVYALAM